MTHDGMILGAVAPFDVDSPWWADMEPVTAALDRLLGVPTAVLRMLSATGNAPAGGVVTYHAEALAPPVATTPWEPVSAELSAQVMEQQPHRMEWAEQGGPASILDWAGTQLRSLGRRVDGRPVQVKSWNLSCLYRIGTDTGPAWIKCTGPFLTPESVAIGLVARHDRDLVPTVLATTEDGGRTLMEEVPGHDCWDVDAETARSVITRFVAVQAAVACSDLAGLPDRRLRTLAARAERLLDDDVTVTLTSAERGALEELVAGLPAHAAAVARLGLPDTLVHADFHPGNWRSDGKRQTIVDWCDAYRGHPAIDVLRLACWVPYRHAQWVIGVWVAAWRAAVPGCDPAPAVGLMAPVGHLEAALTYQAFLDAIEPDERPYHEGDPTVEIRHALGARSAT